MSPITKLLQNDDGPPGPESPFIFGFSQFLQKELNWDVRVVVPSSQKSWIGKAFHIKEDIQGRYYYPRLPDGHGETSPSSRPLKEDEVAEWILFDGTPATCANIALHNLYKDEIDLVISGPNLGRNTSSAFALSSGTIGAAMSGALSGVRSIALSYGIFLKHTPLELHAPAHALGVAIVRRLWEAWGTPAVPAAELYSVNIPMIEALGDGAPLRVCWTRMWRSRYGQLFDSQVPVASANEQETLGATPEDAPQPLLFKFAPHFEGLVRPRIEDLPYGTDAWAVHSGHVSVTPLQAAFAEPHNVLPQDVLPPVEPDANDVEKIMWKLKL
ncbi:sure-like protein [Auricularia subglabra TFB-10046 SS5]|nr:sure-like protein [Auricularia subglabra TFB-10046 SS5]